MPKEEPKHYCLEPYVKEKNMLQLSLFDLDYKKKKTRHVSKWEEEDRKCKLTCHCDFGIPGIFDLDVYTACMRIWTKKGMEIDGITVTYSEIARELGLNPVSSNSKIKQSLKRLALARYEFIQCFVQVTEGGTRRVDSYFSLFDSAHLYTREHQEKKDIKKYGSFLSFPKEIKQNLEFKYYQYLDMAWYRSLPHGLPRRMYEFLEKRRYHAVENVFKISEEFICRWLPITCKHSTQRRKTLQKAADALITAEYLISYNFNKKTKICSFGYAKKRKPFQNELLEHEHPDGINEEVKSAVYHMLEPVQQKTSQEIKPQSGFDKAIAWLQGIKGFHPDRLKEIQMMDHDEIALIYPYIRKRHENGKANLGSVYLAFKKKWYLGEAKEAIEAEKMKEQQRRKNKAIEETMAKKEVDDMALFSKVMGWIDKYGGKEKALYQGYPVVACSAGFMAVQISKNERGSFDLADVKEKNFSKSSK